MFRALYELPVCRTMYFVRCVSSLCVVPCMSYDVCHTRCVVAVYSIHGILYIYTHNKNSHTHTHVKWHSSRLIKNSLKLIQDVVKSLFDPLMFSNGSQGTIQALCSQFAALGAVVQVVSASSSIIQGINKGTSSRSRTRVL